MYTSSVNAKTKDSAACNTKICERNMLVVHIKYLNTVKPKDTTQKIVLIGNKNNVLLYCKTYIKKVSTFVCERVVYETDCASFVSVWHLPLLQE